MAFIPLWDVAMPTGQFNMTKIVIRLLAICVSTHSVSIAGADGLDSIVLQPNKGPLTLADLFAAAEEAGHTPGGASEVDSEVFENWRTPIASDAIGSMPNVDSKAPSSDANSIAS
jgi:hypothetical protein